MTNISDELIQKLIGEKKYETIQEFASISHMGQKPICFHEYNGTEIRAFEQDGNINVLYPEHPTAIQESALAKAISTGSIFDDAEEVSRGVKYINLTIIPARAFAKSNDVGLPKQLTTLTKACIGQMDDQGRLPCSPACIENGYNFQKDMLCAKMNGHDHADVVRHHLGIPYSEDHLPKCLAADSYACHKGLEQIKPFNPEDSIEREDYEEIDPTAEAAEIVENIEKSKLEEDNEKLPTDNDGEKEEDISVDDPDDSEDEDAEEADMDEDDDDEDDDAEDSDDDEDDDEDDEDEDNDENEDEDEIVEEGFISKRPKKLKPLKARETVSYITVELNAIRDANDQAMLSGYICSKLELVDFYINCLDTQDDRYVVPHNRAYLVQFQTDLNRLLTQVLAIKPINKQDRLWQVNVNYPEGWRV